MAIDLDDYGWRGGEPPGDGTLGRIVRVDRGECDVATAAGMARVLSDSQRAQAEVAPATGDWVLLGEDPELGTLVRQVLPRSNTLSRRDPSEAGLEQVLVANVDDVLIVHGLDRPLPAGRLERLLVVAWDSGADVAVALTKADTRAGGSADEVVAVMPPALVECTVEKVAVNAVMAGCRPEYLPVVLAALEAVCTDEFNMHGILATTMGVGPVLVVNGPVASRIGMNSGVNALGQGNRANATIGRAVQLVVRNVGGGAPGGIDRATHGSMAKLGFCFAEDEAGSPWTTLSEDRGFDRSQDVVTAFCGEGPRILVDQKSRSADSLVRALAEGLRSSVSPRVVMGMDGMLVLSPEHMSRFRDAGWDRDRFMAELAGHLTVNVDDVLAGAGGIEEGLPEGFAGMTLPKFRPGGLLVVHAGGPAGLFSSIVGGWLNGPMGSEPTSREITP